MLTSQQSIVKLVYLLGSDVEFDLGLNAFADCLGRDDSEVGVDQDVINNGNVLCANLVWDCDESGYE